jgi:hypothetical protein
MLNSYSTQAQFGEQASKRDITLDEYEKSVLLTKAQEELVMSYYDGKNIYGDSFEATEELRRQLDSLVKTKVYTTQDMIEGTGVSNNSVFFQLPSDLAFITMEQITYNDESLGCYNGSRINVQPTRQDEYNKIKNNPFRGATKYKALRLDAGDGIVEIISKYQVGNYLIRYVSKPEPIILEDLPDGLTIEGVSVATECKLNSILHKIILERAVLMALRAKGINTDR